MTSSLLETKKQLFKISFILSIWQLHCIINNHNTTKLALLDSETQVWKNWATNLESGNLKNIKPALFLLRDPENGQSRNQFKIKQKVKAKTQMQIIENSKWENGFKNPKIWKTETTKISLSYDEFQKGQSRKTFFTHLISNRISLKLVQTKRKRKTSILLALRKSTKKVFF